MLFSSRNTDMDMAAVQVQEVENLNRQTQHKLGRAGVEHEVCEHRARPG